MNKLAALWICVFLLCWLPAAEGGIDAEKNSASAKVPILLYHRLGPSVADSMTVTTLVFESHLKYLKDNGYTIIPLRRLIDYRLGRGARLRPVQL